MRWIGEIRNAGFCGLQLYIGAFQADDEGSIPFTRSIKSALLGFVFPEAHAGKTTGRQISI
jgi:hypothetical protein